MYEAFSGSTCEYEALSRGSSAAFKIQRAAHDYREGGDSDSGEDEESFAQGGGAFSITLPRASEYEPAFFRGAATSS